jgi:uncharacterized RDD family membrane protein YckC
MKSIEIKTTQNVTLEYELADLRDRVVAFLIDLVIMGVVITVLSMVGFSTFVASDMARQIFAIFLICIFLFYSLVLEIFNHGQSFGKMAMKIQVIKTVGGRATFSDYVARWVFRMIDIYFSMGGIASILVASSPKAQRIGDMVANTAVVKLTPKMDLKLADLLNIQSKESYTPVYTEAKHLEEEDVLLIKSALSRYTRYKNNGHQEAIRLLAQQIRNILGLSSTAEGDLQFLKTVLKDYVVLTR